MRILAIKAEYPYPPRTGSAIIAFHQLSRLAKDHDVTLISSGVSDDTDGFAQALRKVVLLPSLNTSRFHRFRRYCFGLLQALPLNVAAFQSEELRRHAQRILDAEEFDVILLYELTAIQYCPDPFLRKAVANLEDPQALKLKRMIKLPIWAPAQRLKLLLDLALVTRYERKMIPRLGRTLVLSANDAEDLRKQTGLSNISDVPYGMTMPAADENPFLRSRNEGMIVFSGNMFHPPNVDGIIFFLDNIFHVICDKACNAKLWIVGNHPDSRIFEAAERFGDKVVITGGVPSVSDYLRKAVVSICPVRLKIGVQTKILEAMALGTPVVSTNAGNSGIGGQSGDHLWVEDEPEFFADRVVSLLAGDKWGELSRGGRRLVSARFGWESSVQQLLGQLKEVSLS